MQFMIGFVENIVERDRTLRAAAFVKPPRNDSKKNDFVSNKDMTNSDYDDLEDSEFDEEDEDYYADEYENESSSIKKKLVLATIVIIVLATCGFVIYTLLNKTPNNSDSNLTPTVTSTASSGINSNSEATVTPDITNSVPTSAVEATPTTAQNNPDIINTHTIQAGELLGAIANRYYGSQASKYLNAIVSANTDKYPDFTTSFYQSGWTIDIPKVD